MKRAIIAVGILLAVIAVGVAYGADEESSSSLVIRPSTMRDGETKTLIDDGRKITVKRNGDAVNIEIEGAGQTRKLTIVKTGDQDIVIDPEDSDTRRRVVIGPGSSRILIDGLPGLSDKKRPFTENWFVCPKDNSMLRVPEAKEDATYKCPVDGTTMERKKGRGFTIWMGDGSLEGIRL